MGNHTSTQASYIPHAPATRAEVPVVAPVVWINSNTSGCMHASEGYGSFTNPGLVAPCAAGSSRNIDNVCTSGASTLPSHAYLAPHMGQRPFASMLQQNTGVDKMSATAVRLARERRPMFTKPATQPSSCPSS